jgi:2,3-bisphosphoglycerate-independent phosphoglycerate mutase
MKLLLFFLDGVGLGTNDPQVNPFARASLPHLEALLDKHKLVANDHLNDGELAKDFIHTQQASLLALDACLDVDGTPQSATGQAALLTGENIPMKIGSHEGPKPSPAIVRLLQQGTLLSRLTGLGKTASLLNAFPPRYFEAIEAGYRLPGVIALSTLQAGIRLKTMQDLFAGNAISADFTAEGWHTALGYENTPLLTRTEAGERLGELTRRYDLTIFEFWLTDVAGHHQDMPTACTLLEAIDEVLGALLSSWDEGRLILVTSDHGNIEDLGTRHHTRNDVPLLLIGPFKLREKFIRQIHSARCSKQRIDLTAIAPAIIDFFG